MAVESGGIGEGVAALSAQHPDAAARKLAAALGLRAGHVVVVAASADDAEALLNRVEAAMVSYRCAWLDGDRLETADLLRALDAGDGATPSLPATMRTFAADARAIGRPVVLVVRRADAAPAVRLERLRLMVDAGESIDWLRLVLLGGPALLAALRDPSGRALATRVTSLIVVEDTAGAVPLAATSELMQEPPDSDATRRRPAAWRIVAAGVLGAAFAAAAVPLVRPRTPAGVASEPPPMLPPAAAPAPAPEPAPEPRPSAATVAPEPPVSPAVTSPPQAIVHERESPAPGRSVQVGAFRDPARATALRDALGKRFEWVMVTQVERDGIVWHRVRVEGLDSAAAVRDAIASLRRAGYQPIVVR